MLPRGTSGSGPQPCSNSSYDGSNAPAGNVCYGAPSPCVLAPRNDLGPLGPLADADKQRRRAAKIPVHQVARWRGQRVVLNQKGVFDQDEIFRKHKEMSEVRYTGFRDRPLEERQARFQNSCREGVTEIAFVATGTNIQLAFNPSTNGYSLTEPSCDFSKEHGKVHIRSNFIMNGVCVRWRGWVDLERLDGVGCLEFDEESAAAEDAQLREQIERYNQRLRDFEERQRAYRQHPERPSDHDLEFIYHAMLQYKPPSHSYAPP